VDVHDLVTGHYGAAGDLATAILRALSGAGVDTDHLGAADLFPVDQLHAGGAPASKHVLDRLGVAPGVRLLDVGCGIGGVSRMAAMAGAAVTGIDLTPCSVTGSAWGIAPSSSLPAVSPRPLTTTRSTLRS
jgi:SAM-dependent methyltransferase